MMKHYRVYLEDRALDELSKPALKLLKHVLNVYGVGYYGYLKKLDNDLISKRMQLSRRTFYRTLKELFDRNALKKARDGRIYFNPYFVNKCPQKHIPVLAAQYQTGDGIDTVIYSLPRELQYDEEGIGDFNFKNVKSVN